MVSVIRPGQRILHIPGIGVQTSRRAVGGGNGLLNNLVAYWPLNEAAGANNALDLHTNALTLTQVSSPGADTGKVYSTARTFDGSADYFTRTSETLLQTGAKDFTLAAWIYKTGSGEFLIVAKDNGTSQREFQLYATDTIGGFGIIPSGGGFSGITTSGMNLSTWHLILAWRDSTKLYLSIDNQTSVDKAVSYSADTSASFDIGRVSYSPWFYWSGRIGPVAMWKSAAGAGGALSAAQRAALYNGGAGLPYASFTV